MNPLEQRQPEFSETVLATTLAAVAQRRMERRRTRQAAALAVIACLAAILFWPAPPEVSAHRQARPATPFATRADAFLHTRPLRETTLLRTVALPESQLVRTTPLTEEFAFRTTETIPRATEADLLLTLASLNGALVRQPDGTRLVVVLK